MSDLAVGSMDFASSTFEVKYSSLDWPGSTSSRSVKRSSPYLPCSQVRFTWPGKQMDTGTVADYKVLIISLLDIFLLSIKK